MSRAVRFAAALVFIFLFAGIASAATFINIGTGSTGGTYYPVGAAMAKVWNASVPGMKANAQSTGGTAQNLALLVSYMFWLTLPPSFVLSVFQNLYVSYRHPKTP